jgi:hypothetical protein
MLGYDKGAAEIDYAGEIPRDAWEFAPVLFMVAPFAPDQETLPMPLRLGC